MNDSPPLAAPTAQARPTRPNAALSLALGAGVSIGAFYLIARGVNLEATRQALANASWSWFAAAFLVQLAAMGFAVRRWQVLLRPHPTRWLPLTQIYFVSHLLNTLLPAKLGTVARVLLASEAEDLNVGLVASSVAIEKVIDTIVALGVFVLLAPFIPAPLWLRETLLVSALLVLALIGIAVSITRFRAAVVQGVARFEARVSRGRSRTLASITSGVIEGLLNLTHRQELLAVLFWTGCIWLAGGLVNQLLFLALGMDPGWSAVWFVMIVLQVGTRVPALPANLGVFHYLVLLALGLYGIPESGGLAYAILLHLVVFILPALIGAVWALPLAARLFRLVTGGAQTLTARPVPEDAASQ